MGSIILPNQEELFLYFKRHDPDKKPALEREDLVREVAFYKVLNDHNIPVPYCTALIEFPNGWSGIVTEDLKGNNSENIKILDARQEFGYVPSWLGCFHTKVDISIFDPNNPKDLERIEFCKTAYALADLYDKSYLRRGYKITRPEYDVGITGMFYFIIENEKDLKWVVGDGKVETRSLKEHVKKELQEAINSIDTSWVMR